MRTDIFYEVDQISELTNIPKSTLEEAIQRKELYRDPEGLIVGYDLESWLNYKITGYVDPCGDG